MTVYVFTQVLTPTLQSHPHPLCIILLLLSLYFYRNYFWDNLLSNKSSYCERPVSIYDVILNSGSECTESTTVWLLSVWLCMYLPHSDVKRNPCNVTCNLGKHCSFNQHANAHQVLILIWCKQVISIFVQAADLKSVLSYTPQGKTCCHKLCRTSLLALWENHLCKAPPPHQSNGSARKTSNIFLSMLSVCHMFTFTTHKYTCWIQTAECIADILSARRILKAKSA